MNIRFISAAAAAAIALSALLACGCGGRGDKPDPKDQSAIEVEVSYEPGAAETAVPDATEQQAVSTPAATQGPSSLNPNETHGVVKETMPPDYETQQPSKPTTAPDSYDYSVFADCAFLGNSTFEGLYKYGVITNSHFFTKVGLNVNSVYTATTSTGSVPVIDELNTGSYRAVILMFGQNECGWPSLDTFISKYAQLLNDVWARQPEAKLFITAVPPVSKEVSDQGANGVTNEHIDYINNGLKQLADNTPNAYFITVPPIMVASDGTLRPEASGGDGIHLNLEYTRHWADHICAAVSEVLL